MKMVRTLGVALGSLAR